MRVSQIIPIAVNCNHDIIHTQIIIIMDSVLSLMNVLQNCKCMKALTLKTILAPYHEDVLATNALLDLSTKL